ncbi:39S ribosomal protein L33, mitochondrial [Nowakowskiella sp. JEL0407]|nr:39S ribosomal protein L33, mitochondrial [Nowakowskiella sp. JEL0407]
MSVGRVFAHGIKRQRHLTDTKTAISLPTSFKYSPPLPTFPSLSALPPPIAKTHEHPFNYKYYQVTLHRGTFGLPESTKRVLNALGLTRRHLVVYLPVNNKTAGSILKVKELVRVECCNELPPVVNVPKGFKVVGSAVAGANNEN